MDELYKTRKSMYSLAAPVIRNYKYLISVKTGIDEQIVRKECEEKAEKLGLYFAETDKDIQPVLDRLNGWNDEQFIIISLRESITEKILRKQ